MIPIDVHIYYLAYTENNLKYSASLKENVLQDGLICKDIFNAHYLESALSGAALSQVEQHSGQHWSGLFGLAFPNSQLKKIKNKGIQIGFYDKKLDLKVQHSADLDPDPFRTKKKLAHFLFGFEFGS